MPRSHPSGRSEGDYRAKALCRTWIPWMYSTLSPNQVV